MKEYHGSGICALEHLPQGEVPAFLRAPATQGARTFHHTMAEYAPPRWSGCRAWRKPWGWVRSLSKTSPTASA